MEERDLVQVEVLSGSGMFFADLSPLYIRRICAEIRPKMVGIYII